MPSRFASTIVPVAGPVEVAAAACRRPPPGIRYVLPCGDRLGVRAVQVRLDDRAALEVDGVGPVEVAAADGHPGRLGLAVAIVLASVPFRFASTIVPSLSRKMPRWTQ